MDVTHGRDTCHLLIKKELASIKIQALYFLIDIPKIIA